MATSGPRFCLIGPTFPFRGGIAHYTTLLARELAGRHETLLVSFASQYPNWLFPGESDRDPSTQPLQSEAEFLLSPLDISSWVRTVDRVRAWKPDSIVLPWWVPVWTPAWAYLGRAFRRLDPKPRIISICHNARPHEGEALGGPAHRAALKLALGSSDAFVVHAASEERGLRRVFGDADIRITPLPSFGDLGVVASTPLPVELPTDRPILLFCGFIRPYKGLDVLLAALPRVLERHRVHLAIVGEFWENESRYRSAIEELDIGAHVTIVSGYVPNETLVGFLRAASVVVLPYRHATQSAVLQLAFGVGRPAIVSAVGGLPDVVDHGQTGLLVEPGDPVALADAIVKFVDEELGPVFERNIRAQAERFSWGHLVDHLVDLSHG